jgi:hypothetical protein
MPNVNGKKFPYTPAGMAAAKKASMKKMAAKKMTGKKMSTMKRGMGRGK